MPKHRVIIPIFAQAPLKPGLGEPCNGCGVCCLLEPCPLGVLLSGSRRGECLALRWQSDAMHYRCGAITMPCEVLSHRLPSVLAGFIPVLAWLMGKWARRWVAAGIGCDCDAQLDVNN
jgi:hypothetical protein